MSATFGSKKTTLLALATISLVTVLTGGLLLVLGLTGDRLGIHSYSRSRRLSTLAGALHNYRDSFGRFPPASIQDDTGQPMHSWRCLLVPFIQASAFYDRYDWKRPWNASDNMALESLPIGEFFRRPGSPSAPQYHTNYVMVVDSHDPSATVSMRQWARREPNRVDSGRAVIVLEVLGKDIHWMSPEDVTIEEIETSLSSRKAGSNAFQVMRGVVVNPDGTVDLLQQDHIVKVLDGLVTSRRKP